MASYVIGDVHGQYDGLRHLLAKIKYKKGRDELWFVGDLVNRGPKSLEVLRFVVGLGKQAKVVLGNHDFSLMVQALDRPEVKIKATTREILSASDGRELVAAMRKWPMMVVDKKRRVVMTHAGLYPGWTVKTAETLNGEIMHALQGKKGDDFLARVYHDHPHCWSRELIGMDRLRFGVNAFCRMRFLTEKGCLDFAAKTPPDQAPKGLEPWYMQKTRSRYRCVFGHWAAQGLTITPAWACIDGGAAWGGKLVAFDLDRWDVAGSVAVK